MSRSEHLHVIVTLLSANIVQAAMTVKTKVIDMLLSYDDIPFVQINEGLRLQVIPDIEGLPYCQKHQFAAFILAEKMLVVWEDQPHRLIERASNIVDALFNMVSRDPPFNDKLDRDDPKNTYYHWQGVHEESEEDERRSIVLWQPFFTASTLILMLVALGLGWRQISIEIATDGGFKRLLFLVCLVPQLWLGLFFFQALVGNFAQIVGCVGHMRLNTKVYSGKAPYRLCSADLPHVTIQMPIFKESLRTVIAPTLRSLKEAISTYEMQGGSANIFVNDDGMQMMTDDEAKERQIWFDENNIGWVARPPHNPDGKIEDRPIHNRRGKFKKASNMNYALRISVDIEKELAKSRYQFQRENSDWSQMHENEAYTTELGAIIDRNGAWADGNIRIGDYVLIVDSDTRVPSDCLLEAVSEMEKCRDVAILQFASGVMNVTTSFFERGITFFTNLVYTQIKFAVSNGDVAPFVGHNAMLRWSAVQEIAYNQDEQVFLPKKDAEGNVVMADVLDPTTGEPVLDELTEQPRREPVYEPRSVPIEKYWSEVTVSEDFDMALRLQTKGYIVRLAAYQDEGFKEGVSLTVYDELNRWEKYAPHPRLPLSSLTSPQIRLWLQRAHLPPLEILAPPWALHRSLPPLPDQRHPTPLQAHHHRLHRDLLRARLSLAAHPQQLLPHRVVQRHARPLLH
jgi:cellulose synthase/poly-beta-1,6-N-acetylglucosamine synthase-like glycosyltransferase